jgi:hypothetical protein
MINIAQESKTRKTSEIRRMLTETDMTMLFFRSRRSETIRCRASAAPQQQLKDQFAINNKRKYLFLTAALYNVKISASSHHSGTKKSDES